MNNFQNYHIWQQQCLLFFTWRLKYNENNVSQSVVCNFMVEARATTVNKQNMFQR